MARQRIGQRFPYCIRCKRELPYWPKGGKALCMECRFALYGRYPDGTKVTCEDFPTIEEAIAEAEAGKEG